MISLVATSAQMDMEGVEGFLPRIEAAMKSAANHFMVLDEQQQLKGALAALLLAYGDDTPEGRRLRHEVAALTKLSAVIAASQAGLMVTLDDLLDDDTERPEPIGLVRMWHAAKGR